MKANWSLAPEEQQARVSTRVVLLVVFLMAAVAAAPGYGQPRPWDLTDEERGARRADPALNEQRVMRAGKASQARGSSALFIISGRHNPELFFSPELLGNLLLGAFAGDELARKHYRTEIESQVRDIGITDTQWQLLEELSEPLRQRVGQAEKQLALQIGPIGSNLTMTKKQALAMAAEVARPLCQERKHLVSKLSKEMGEEWLMQVLYRGVAPLLTVFFDASDPAERTSLKGGCP